MKLSDHQITNLLEWFRNESISYNKWAPIREDGLKKSHEWLQPEIIENLSNTDLKEKFIEYYKKGTGDKQHLNQINRDRIIRDIDQFRKTILFLLDENIEIEKRIDQVLQGSHKIDRLGRAITTAILMDFKPDKYCLWNNKSEKGFFELGWELYKHGDSVGNKYTAFLKNIYKLKELNKELNLSNLDVDLFLHVISSETEGIEKLNELKGPIKSEYLILGYKDASSWQDEFGKYYHFGETVPNYKKLKTGSVFLLQKKNVGFVGHGTIKEIKNIKDNSKDKQEYRAIYDKFMLIEPPIELNDAIRGTIASAEGYNVQHSIKVINEDIYRKILGFIEVNKSWIFQANPEYYDIGKAVHQLKTINWSVRQYKKQIKAGDEVFIYQCGPDAGVLGTGTVMTDPQEMHDDPDSKQFVISKDALKEIDLRVQVRIDKVLQKIISRKSLKNEPSLAGLPLFKVAQGTNFALTQEQAEAINKLIENGTEPSPAPVQEYIKEDALKDLFISEKDFDYVMCRLKLKKNIILQGPPGVGKTFIAKRLAYYLMGFKDDSRISMVQFHQSYSYEDFIQGFRPNEDGKFTLRNGLFYEFCRLAVKNSGKKYIFIIDEINRGNLSKIFGEMLMLIEADKRGQQFAVPLTYGKGNSDTFFIPENLYLIGTMNTADRSLAMVDYALRRRFSFIDLEPKFKNSQFRQNLETAGVKESLITLIIDRMEALNQTISEDTKNLGTGYCIGHSHFCPTGNEQPYDESWYRMVIKSEIEPLLREYWFDDPKRVADNIGKLLAGIPE